MNKYHGIFKNWHIGIYTIDSPCGKYSLWIPNGFSFFSDHDCPRSLLSGLSIIDRYLLWREYKNEKKRRLMDIANSVDAKKFIRGLK